MFCGYVDKKRDKKTGEKKGSKSQKEGDQSNSPHPRKLFSHHERKKHEQSKSNGDSPLGYPSKRRDQVVCSLSHYSDLWHHQVRCRQSFREISTDYEDVLQDQHRTQSTTLSSGGASSAIFALLQRATRVEVDPCPSRDLRRDLHLFASHRQESSGSRLCFPLYRNAFPPGSTRADLLRV